MKYKYRFVNENGYRFELLPNNSNNCPVGYSGNYETYDQAIEGLKKFKNYMANKNQNDIVYDMKTPIQIPSRIRGKYQGGFCFGDSKEMFYTRAYYQRNQIKVCIDRVLNHYNSDIHGDLNKL